MQSGALRYRVTIQQQATSRSTMGSEQPTWTTFAQTWAGFEPLSGRELLAAKQVQGEDTTRITIRYMAGINPKMRVIFLDRRQSNKTRIFDITSITNTGERNREIVMLCIERYQ
jgi:SPP1 family predicted phage head-tail adaptor